MHEAISAMSIAINSKTVLFMRYLESFLDKENLLEINDTKSGNYKITVATFCIGSNLGSFPVNSEKPENNLKVFRQDTGEFVITGSQPSKQTNKV